MFPPSSNSNVPRFEIAERMEFSAEEREQLLWLAHEGILSLLEGREPSLAVSSRFSAPRGAFTTIYLHGKLRGCVGYVHAISPLHRTIIETARGAAFEDTRFTPVTLQEARNLRVSLSILSLLEPLQPEDLEIGKHGLLISQHGRRGLLLPQVPGEHGWDRITFLEQTCRKAGLPTDAWKSGAGIEAFTAEVFSDPGAPE